LPVLSPESFSFDILIASGFNSIIELSLLISYFPIELLYSLIKTKNYLKKMKSMYQLLH